MKSFLIGTIAIAAILVLSSSASACPTGVTFNQFGDAVGGCETAGFNRVGVGGCGTVGVPRAVIVNRGFGFGGGFFNPGFGVAIGGHRGIVGFNRGFNGRIGHGHGRTVIRVRR